MKKVMALLGSVLLLLGLPSCKTKSYAANELPAKRIIFGNGGGFTGLVTEYHLFENGQLFQKASLNSDELTPLPNMDRKVCRRAFKTMTKMDTTLLGANQPGNRYYFLEWRDGEQEVRTVWGAEGFSVGEKVEEVYKVLFEFIDESTFLIKQ